MFKAFVTVSTPDAVLLCPAFVSGYKVVRDQFRVYADTAHLGDFHGDIGAARVVDPPFNSYPQVISAARVNLNLTRRAHASVYASSTCRVFELTACGAAVVSNPHLGIERWFEPGSEILVVSNASEAIAAYRELLADPAQAEEMGRRARARVLDEHTYEKRAQRLLELTGLREPIVTGAGR